MNVNLRNRENWIDKTLSNIPAGLSILDAGAGELKYKEKCKHLVYTSQDFGQYDGKGDSAGLQTSTWDNSKLDIVCDIIDIPVKDSSFDVIMCIEVIEHIPNPVLAIEEFFRILKPNGILIITAPFCSLTHFSPYHFSTGFSRYYYEHHLSKGFDIVEITPNGNYNDYIVQELSRTPSMLEKYTQNKILKIIGYILALPLKLFLQSTSSKVSKSSELLTFGYHVVARKKQNS